MDDGFQFLDIILLAAVAGFIFLRLRSVLGRRMGHEQAPPEEKAQRQPEGHKAADLDDSQTEDNIVLLGDKSKRPSTSPFGGSELARTLSQIRQIDRSFDQTSFTAGAQAAYESIVVAFAQSDRDTLQALLADDVYDNFARSIDEREAEKQVMSTDIVAIHSADIIEANLVNKEAEITIKFEAEMISMTKDEDGIVVSGSAQPQTVHEIWTFARDLKSRNPNWLLITTRSAN